MRRSISVLVISLFFCAVGFRAGPAGAQVKGLIVGPGAERYPIAVSPLKNLGERGDGLRLSEGVADVIARDLELSGWFRILDRSAYIESPKTGSITLGGFDFRDWSTIGAQGLVKGGFVLRGEELALELRLFDVYQQKQIVGKRYSGGAKDYRRMAHKFVDEIILQFTGVPGVFDTRIAFVATGGDRFKEIYIAHLDGSDRVQVTHNRTINLLPSWTPDARAITYTSYRDFRPELYLFDLVTGKESKFSARPGLNLRGKWSADGKYFAVALEKEGNTDLYLLDRRGKEVKRLTDTPGIDVSPSWSSDGTRLVFVSDRSGSPQLYVMELPGGQTRRLTYTGSYNTSPDWSPTGDKIAYVARTGGRFQITTIDAGGGEPRVLTDARDNEDPSWSPDGRFIIFTSNRSGRYQLYIMQSSGENQRRLTTSGGHDTDPSWSPRLK